MQSLSYVHKPPAAPYECRIIADYLDERTEEHPDREAAVYYDINGERSCITYRQLWDQSIQLAAGLLTRGLKRGYHVLLIAPNCLEYIVIEMACARIGVILVLQKFGTPAVDASETAVNTNCSAIFVVVAGSSVAYGVSIVQEWQKSARHESNDGPLAICAGIKDLAGTIAYEDHIRPLEGATDGEKAAVFGAQKNVQMEDPLFGIMTSGSTGKPKVTLYTHASFIHLLKMCFTMFPDFNGARYFNDRPFSWAVGSMIGTYQTAFAGYTMVFLDPEVTVKKGDVATIKRIIRDEKCTHAILMPYMLHDLIRSQGDSNEEMPLLKYGLTTGQPLAKSMVVEFMKKHTNIQLGQTYGCTEFGAFSKQYYHSVADVDSENFNFLEMAPNTEAKVVGSDGRIVQKGSVGELLLRGPMLFREYLGNEESTAKAFTPERWFKTGDLVTMNRDGCVRVLSRLADSIKRATWLIFPIEIELVLAKHPDVDQVIVVGVPDERLYEEMCACVILTHGPAGSSEKRLDAIKSWSAGQFSPGPDGLTLAPKFYIVFEDYPKTHSGKTSRRELRDIAAKKLNLSQR